VHRLDLSTEPVPGALRTSSSTHAVGLVEAIELARALARLPPRVLVYGVEGVRFETGAVLSRDVDAAIEPLTDAVRAEAAALAQAARLNGG